MIYKVEKSSLILRRNCILYVPIIYYFNNTSNEASNASYFVTYITFNVQDISIFNQIFHFYNNNSNTIGMLRTKTKIHDNYNNHIFINYFSLIIILRYYSNLILLILYKVIFSDKYFSDKLNINYLKLQKELKLQI